MRTCSSLASLARVSLEVLSVRDLSAYLAARKMPDSEEIRSVPGVVFSKEIVKFVAGSLTLQCALTVCACASCVYLYMPWLFPGKRPSPLDARTAYGVANAFV